MKIISYFNLFKLKFSPFLAVIYLIDIACPMTEVEEKININSSKKFFICFCFFNLKNLFFPYLRENKLYII